MEAQDQPQLLLPSAGEHHPSHGRAGASTGQLSCAQCRGRKLRCDRKRPRCNRCLEKGETCTYPEIRQRNLGRRKTVRDLEERIEELESLLRTATIGTSGSTLPPSDNLPRAGPSAPSVHPEPAAGQLVDLGLFEQLPSFDLVDELTAIFFQKIHAGAPMLHRTAYTAALRLPPHMRPPMCLQYIVMASAAATSAAHRHLSEPFYQRARVYAEADELQGQGEVFTTVAHVQAWCLISAYECHVYAIFTRASTSLCRAVRIAQMLKLHTEPTSSLPPPRNHIEAEERRRAWWVVFLADRYLTSTTGWPSLIDERHISVPLPSAENTFADGSPNPHPVPLSEGLRRLEQGLGEQLSPFAIRILAANELLHALDHCSEAPPPVPDHNNASSPPDTCWARHRQILTNLTILSNHLPPTVYLSLNPQPTLDALLIPICTALATFHLHKPFPGPIPTATRTTSEPLLSAAQTILSTIQVASASDLLATVIRNPIVPFAAYIAASIFLSHCEFRPPPAGNLFADTQECEDGLQYLAGTLLSFATASSLARVNTVQLARDLQRVGRGWLMERVLGMSEGVGSLLAAGDAAGGGMVFCPALGEAGVAAGSGAGGSSTGGGQGNIWGGGYDETVLGGLEGVGLPGVQGSTVSQVNDPEGLFSQLEEVGFQGFA